MIKLNFLSIDLSQKKKIYVSPYEPNSEKQINENRVYKLNDSLLEVSQKSIEGFNEYDYTYSENYNLTKWIVLNEIFSGLSKIGELETYIQGKGKFESVILVIGYHKLGKRTIKITPYYISEFKSVGILYSYEFRPKDRNDRSKESQILSLSLDKNGLENKNIYSDRFRIANWFIKKFVEDINENSDIHLNDSLLEVDVGRLKKKEYLFKDGRVHNSQFLGVRNHGPYKSIEKNITYIFLFENRYRIFANDLFKAMKGISYPGTFSGMNKFFQTNLETSDIRHVSIQDYSEIELENAISKIESIDNSSEGQSIVIFIEPSIDDTLIPSPYYYTKLECIKRNIPVQVINYEERSKKNALKWSASNIGLQIFTKCGGIPWLVKPSVSDCLILGIGTSHNYDYETKSITKYYAYSVCLDSSGEFRELVVLGSNTDQNEFHNELRTNVVRLFKGGQFSNYKRCALHVPSKLRRDDIELLNEALESVSDVDFSIIKVNTKNPLYGFSDHNTKVPYESDYVKIDASQYLVWFEGLHYGREIVRHRLSGPVHLEVLYERLSSHSSSRMDYIQDVINLSGANWRGFNAKLQPVSIYYSVIVSRYKSAFDKIDDSHQDSIEYNLPWFL